MFTNICILFWIPFCNKKNWTCTVRKKDSFVRQHLISRFMIRIYSFIIILDDCISQFENHTKEFFVLVTRLHQVIIFRTFHLSDEKNCLMSSCFIFFSRGDCFFFIRFINIMYTLGKKSSKVKRMPPDNIYCY